MAENDIYDSETKYKRVISELDNFRYTPKERLTILKLPQKNVGKYFCKNKTNMQYFKPLIKHFEVTDLSYVQRLRRLQTFKQILHYTSKDLKNIDSKDDRQEIENIIILARKDLSDISVSYFIADLKYTWKILFPARDEKGRPDETRIPYCVRHLKRKVDVSREKLRPDRMNIDEYIKILDYASRDPRLQFYIALAYESLGRPQEILRRKLKDIKLYDNYAKIYISEGGKEGCGILRCADSYSYLLKLLDIHPQRSNPKAYIFFLKEGDAAKGMSIALVNKMLRNICEKLKIDKPIRSYSFKRNNVTNLRLLGEDDKDIQSRARWKSTKQLHTYDIASQEEAFEADLIKKGILKPKTKEQKKVAPTTKLCAYCGIINTITAKTCSGCKRLLWKEDIEAEEKDKQKKELDLMNRLERQEKSLEELRIFILKDQKNKRNNIERS